MHGVISHPNRDSGLVEMALISEVLLLGYERWATGDAGSYREPPAATSPMLGTVLLLPHFWHDFREKKKVKIGSFKRFAIFTLSQLPS